MKNLFLSLALISLAMVSYGQRIIKPSLGYNSWSLGDGVSISFIELGVDYEHVVNENVALTGGLSYNLENDYIDGFVSLNLGGTYHIDELNNGFFAGGSFGYGFIDDGNIQELIAKVGYSFPLGNGIIHPSIGLGNMSVGGDGFRFGGLIIPINVSYTIEI